MSAGGPRFSSVPATHKEIGKTTCSWRLSRLMMFPPDSKDIAVSHKESSLFRAFAPSINISGGPCLTSVIS